jgi:hypothetical protein
MKSCEVFLCGDSFYIFPKAETVDGIRYNCPPFSKIGKDIDGSALGETIYLSLQSSKSQVKIPSDLKNVVSQTVTFTGYKTWNSFARHSLGICIEWNGDEAFIIPLSGQKDGSFSFVPEKKMKISNMNSSTIGAHVINVFSELTLNRP